MSKGFSLRTLTEIPRRSVSPLALALKWSCSAQHILAPAKAPGGQWAALAAAG